MNRRLRRRGTPARRPRPFCLRRAVAKCAEVSHPVRCPRKTRRRQLASRRLALEMRRCPDDIVRTVGWHHAATLIANDQGAQRPLSAIPICWSVPRERRLAYRAVYDSPNSAVFAASHDQTSSPRTGRRTPMSGGRRSRSNARDCSLRRTYARLAAVFSYFRSVKVERRPYPRSACRRPCRPPLLGPACRCW
jgi:hypothetical protein